MIVMVALASEIETSWGLFELLERLADCPFPADHLGPQDIWLKEESPLARGIRDLEPNTRD
jgi:hypothetical protein